MPFLILVVCSLLLLLSNPLYALELTERDHGRTLTIAAGEQVTLRLEGNPTTGYLWELLRYNQELLTLVGETGFVRDADRPGAGGRFVFRFAPRAAGETRLQLVYLRPWEKKVKPIRTFEVVLKIQGSGGAVEEQPLYQPIFRRVDDLTLLRVTRPVEPVRAAQLTGMLAAPLGVYRAGKLQGTEILLVLRGRQSALSLSVPSYSERPLEARWLNAKLLYLELWFNPRNGVYWIFDVEQERLVLHELMQDGRER